MCQNRNGVLMESLGPYGRYVDECMVDWIRNLNLDPTTETLACCCGHRKYPTTIVVTGTEVGARTYEIISGKSIPRVRNFYKQDSEGYYYIPETL